MDRFPVPWPHLTFLACEQGVRPPASGQKWADVDGTLMVLGFVMRSDELAYQSADPIMTRSACERSLIKVRPPCLLAFTL